MYGTIFDIKEFAVHDGPGARITVFLKGCPLRCRWCHNPEGLSCLPQLMYKENLCTHCGMCRKPCSHEECKPFGRCIHACANGCLAVSGRQISSEELAQKLNKNTEVLSMMDGGVTFSGGEPMLHADFVCDVIKRLNNLHTAIQTSGFTDSDTYKRVTENIDFIMQDIKIADTKKHIEYTGVSNEKILKNIEYLKTSGKNFVFRVPLIPGITDTEENLTAISEIAGDCRTELLKYNGMAGAKYEMLGMKYPLGNINPNDRDLTAYFKNAVMG